MKVTKEQLREMIRKVVRETLAEQAPAWGAQNTPKGLGGFASKAGTGSFKTNVQKAQKAAAEKAAAKQAKQTGDDFATDKTHPGGAAAAQRRKRLEQAKKIENLRKQVYYEIDQASMNPAKLQAVLDLLRKDQAN